MSSTSTRSWLFFLFLSGCATPAIVHPDFARLQPHTLSVLEIKNETIADLGAAEFGGFLQRGVLGAETYDILSLLRSSLQEGLLERGYKLVPVSAESPADAVVELAVESWIANAMANFPSFTLRYRLEIRRLPTAETLYQGTFVCEERSHQRPEAHGGVATAISRSIARALKELPARAP